MAKKYYWLKLQCDFFKRQEAQIIESMPNGKDYMLFYLKLLCESVGTEGRVRFNEEIPYSEEMLSVITNTKVEIVKQAIEVFVQFHMMEVLDDGTYFMLEVEKMIGSETYWAQKKREQRSKEKELENVQHVSNTSQICPTKRESIDKELDKDKELDSVPSPKKEFSLEWAWEYTAEHYPRKQNIGNAHEIWLEMVTKIPGAEKETARDIHDGMMLYVEDYQKNNPDDTDYRFILSFGKWLKQESSHWIKLALQYRSEREAYLREQTEVNVDE